jgi:hypothetical protein
VVSATIVRLSRPSIQEPHRAFVDLLMVVFVDLIRDNEHQLLDHRSSQTLDR